MKFSRRIARRALSAFGVTIAAAAAALATPSPASAGHGADFIIPDNRNHCVDRHNLTTKGNRGAQRGVSQIDRTVMNADFGCSGDVHVYDYNYGDTDWYGYTRCTTRAWWNPFRCDVYVVQFNSYNLGSTYEYPWLKVGCHEFGHTAGLWHRSASNDTDNNSCMQSGLSRSRTYFDAHDVRAVNNYM